jgi:hypothetical protein
MNTKALWPLECCGLPINCGNAAKVFRGKQLEYFFKKKEEYECKSFMYC